MPFALPCVKTPACLTAHTRATAPEYLHIPVNRGCANIPQAQKRSMQVGTEMSAVACPGAWMRQIIRRSRSHRILLLYKVELSGGG